MKNSEKTQYHYQDTWGKEPLVAVCRQSEDRVHGDLFNMAVNRAPNMLDRKIREEGV